MRKYLFVLVAAVAALGMMSHGAEAAKKKRHAAQVTVTPWNWWWQGPWTVRDPRLATSNTIVGGAATGGYFAIRNSNTVVSNTGAYALTSIGCAAVSPIVGTMVVGRELSMREVWVSTSNCFVPVVGGWLANNYFDRHPEWDLAPGQRKK
jgi:hypothetical protein